MSDVPSFQRRLMTTSFGDVLGLRMSGNLDWKGEVSRSELPENIQTMIHDLVRQSRLFRFEKASVAKELVAHFQDGNERGVSYDQLIADFGDAKVASTLIRRSKRRNRSFMMKATNMLGYAVLGLLAVYAAMFAFFNMASPDIKIDFVAKLNEKYIDVPPAEKAWPIYREAWLDHEFPEDGFSEILHDQKDENGMQLPKRLAKVGDSEWEAAVAFNASKQAMLDEVRRAASLPLLGLELQANTKDYSDADYNLLFGPVAANGERDELSWVNAPNGLLDGAFINILLPHLERFRKTVMHLEFDSRVAVTEGDADRYIKNFHASLGIVNHSVEAEMLVSGLVGISLTETVFDQLEETLIANPDLFSDEQLLEIQNAIQSIDVGRMVSTQGERMFIEDIFQRVYSDNGDGDGRMTHEGIKIMKALQVALSGNAPSPDMELDNSVADVFYSAIGPASLVTVSSRKESTELLNKWMNEADAEFQRPWYSRGDALGEMQEILRDNGLKYAVLGMIMPAVEQVDDVTERVFARRDGVAMALAIHRFHQREDRWPDTADELTPSFISKIPVDRLSGGPIQFRVKDEAIIVYGFGSDLDDDGGKPVFNEYPNPDNPGLTLQVEDPARDGDWILWPMSTWGNNESR